jgi:hypothetical protein
VKFGSPVHSTCDVSAMVSTSAISGLVGVTGGGSSDGETTWARHAFGVTDSGSSGTADTRVTAFGWA